MSARSRSINEITAVPKLLQMLSLKGCIVTADALNCQRQLRGHRTRRRLARSEGNQGSLHIDDPEAATPRLSIEHAPAGPIAWRRTTWPGLAAQPNARDRRAQRKRHTICSAPVRRAVRSVAATWGVENGLHWVLDVTMNEDQARHCKDHGPENIALCADWHSTWPSSKAP